MALVGSPLALLGTSAPKGWSIAATLPQTQQATGTRVLEVSIEASTQPSLRATAALNPYGQGDTPCLSRWASGRPLICILPPDTPLAAVTIGGPCPGGCSGKCVPPPNAFVRATAREVTGWKATSESRLALPIPNHRKGWTATIFDLHAGGAAFIRAKLTVTSKATGTTMLEETQVCRNMPGASAATDTYCSFLVSDSLLPSVADVDVVADVTGWGACAGDVACAAPGTLHIASLGLAP
jgi:hypothetical protein